MSRTEYRVMTNGLVYRIDVRERRRVLGFTWWSAWWSPEPFSIGLKGRLNYFSTAEEAFARIDRWREVDAVTAAGWREVTDPAVEAGESRTVGEHGITERTSNAVSERRQGGI